MAGVDYEYLRPDMAARRIVDQLAHSGQRDVRCEVFEAGIRGRQIAAPSRFTAVACKIEEEDVVWAGPLCRLLHSLQHALQRWSIASGRQQHSALLLHVECVQEEPSIAG